MVKTPNDLSHKEQAELISLVKKALELACAKLACYEGLDSPSANPEEWVGRAYLMTRTTGWKKDDKGI